MSELLEMKRERATSVQDRNKNAGHRRESEEKHESTRGDSKTYENHSADGKKLTAKDSSLLEDSVPQGTTRREAGPAEMTRRKIRHARDARTNLGTGLPSDVVIGG